MDTFSKAWDSFADSVIPAEASDAQIDDMELAFYAGAIALVMMTRQTRADSPDTGQANRKLGMLSAELNAFRERYFTRVQTH